MHTALQTEDSPDLPLVHLGQTLAVNIPGDTGSLRLGQLPKEAVATLMSLRDAENLVPSDRGAYAGSSEALDNPILKAIGLKEVESMIQFNPVSDEGKTRTALSLLAQNVSIKNLMELDGFRLNFVACDYFGLHTDEHVHCEVEVGTIAILLNAPKGALLYTNKTHQAVLQPGDVVIIDDSKLHGAFPLSAPDKISQHDSFYVQPAETRIQFSLENHMTWLVIDRQLY
jgi:hypothetical protein